jgi:Retrotransposon gag protein
MKTGKAEKWAARVFYWEKENLESYRFVDWEDFCQEFKEEFCPTHTDIAAITCLESTSYFQNKHFIDEYLDKFLDLVFEAGYTDNRTIVVKFHRGLDPCIQDAVTTMTSRHPSDRILF